MSEIAISLNAKHSSVACFNLEKCGRKITRIYSVLKAPPTHFGVAKISNEPICIRLNLVLSKTRANHKALDSPKLDLGNKGQSSFKTCLNRTFCYLYVTYAEP